MTSSSRMTDRLSWPEFQMLSTFNGEKARGLIHTDSWRDEMRSLQERFNAAGFQSEKNWRRETRRR